MFQNTRAAAAALASAGALVGLVASAAPQGGPTLVTPATIDQLTTELSAKYGDAERARIDRGVKQAAQFWRKGDGDEKAFADVVRAQVCADSNARNALFSRMEFGLESLDGHMNEIVRDWIKLCARCRQRRDLFVSVETAFAARSNPDGH